MLMMDDREPVLYEPSECALYVIADGEDLALKERALDAQPSQTAGLKAFVGREAYLSAISEEAFVNA